MASSSNRRGKAKTSQPWTTTEDIALFDSKDVNVQEVAPMGRDRAKKKASSYGARSKTSIAGDPSLVDALLMSGLELEDQKRCQIQITMVGPGFLARINIIKQNQLTIHMSKMWRRLIHPSLLPIFQTHWMLRTYGRNFNLLDESLTYSSIIKYLNKTFIKVPSPSFVVDERVIWIEVSGLPLCAWGSSSFKKIANIFGKFNFFDDDVEDSMCMGRACITTKIQSLIFEKVNVTIKDSIFDVHVKEIGSWSTLISNDMDSNEADDDYDMEEHRSTNEDVDPNAALDDEDKPSEVDVSDMAKPPSFKKFIKKNSECSISSNASRSGVSSDEDKSSRINKLQELDYFEKMNFLDLMQKARVKWEVDGDKNSKFFHGLINSRRKSQSIHGIMHEGVWLSDPKDIKEAFLNFYKKKFSCHDSQVSFPSFMPDHRLNTLDHDLLEAIVSMEDIKTADDIQEFVVSFFSSGKFPQGVNSAFITLIPKVSNPLFIKDYRPIYLIGLYYKIVSKILSNRLSKVIDSIIGPEQSAFISGRQILDVPLILSEIIDWYKKRKKKLMLLKVDFGLQFSRISILINESPTSEFSLKRGLRQGDPLSPFLSIIVMEGLHMALNDGIASNMFHGVRIVLRLIFTNLMYLELEFRTVKLSPWLHVLVMKQILIDRFKARLSGIHYFSIFKAPEMDIKSLESLRANFFWGSYESSKKLSWVKWSNTLASFDKGGLGVGSLSAFNKALLLKWR
nr:RNA-directed DNA polymerase, eukaryota [Tanacetum cinerariifolium]